MRGPMRRATEPSQERSAAEGRWKGRHRLAEAGPVEEVGGRHLLFPVRLDNGAAEEEGSRHY